MTRWWLSVSQKLMLATWPLVLGTCLTSGWWVVKSLHALEIRIIELENFGPKAGKRFTQAEADKMELKILSEVAAAEATRQAALQSQLKVIEHGLVRVQVQLEQMVGGGKHERD